MRRIFHLTLLCLVGGVVSACKPDSVVATENIPTAGVRFINAVPDSAGAFGMDLRFVDNAIVESNAQFRIAFRNSPSAAAPFVSTAIEFKGARAGQREFRIFLDDTIQTITSTVVKDTTVTLVASHNYTAWLWGYGRSAAADKMHLDFIDEVVADPAAQVAIRVVNATNAAIDVRAYVQGTAVPAAPTWANVPPFSASAYVLVAPASMMYNVQPAGGGAALFADARALPGAVASCSGQPCVGAQQPDEIATPGTTVAGSAVSALVFPRSTPPEPKPATAPVVTLGGAGNVDNGLHSYRVTFVTPGGETDGGPASAGVVTTATAGQVALSAIPLGSAAVTARRVYRTLANGSSYRLLTTLADNTSTTYTDNTADVSLGTTLPTANSTVRTPQTAAFAVPAITFMWDRRPPSGCDPKLC